jgi:hypothetical protein
MWQVRDRRSGAVTAALMPFETRRLQWITTSVVGLAVLLILVAAASADDVAAGKSNALRSRFGFDPLKRQPLSMLYRMDLAGNRNDVLDIDEIPTGAEPMVTGLAARARVDATRPIPLESFAVAWQTRAAANWPPKPVKAIVIHRATPSKPTQTTPDPEQLGKTLLGRYDRDGSGALEQAEWQQMGGAWARRDLDHDTQLSVDELAAYFASHQEVRQQTAGDDARPDRTENMETTPSGVSEAARDVPRQFSAPRYYRTRAAVERVPAGLPGWFLQKDANGDGQIAMCEFASQWDESKVADFRQYDLNDDGMITQKELSKTQRRREEGATAATSAAGH